MAKILLIKTSRHEHVFPHIISPPLGVMYLASMLHQNTSHQVKIVDMWVDYLEPVDVLNEVSRFKPDIVGISSVSPEAEVLHQVAKEIKQVSSYKIIAGGPHVTISPEDGLNDPNIDYIVLGEGEYTLVELVETILGDGDVSKVKGIGFRENGNFVKTPPREYIQNLDELPFPAWDLIKLKEYGKHWRGNILQPRRPYMPIMTSRGCPYHCIFCHNVLGKRFRPRSPENVFAEIETLYHDYHIRDIEIQDDNFNLEKERVHKICELIINSGIKINLSCVAGLRGDLVDEGLLLKLHQAGTYQISYAIETASPRLQKLIKKNINLVKIEKNIKKTSELGISTWGFFMIGFPTETRKELKETGKFALGLKLDAASFFIVNPLPGTELSRMVRKKNRYENKSSESFSFWYGNFNLSKVKDKELLAIQKRFYVTFYLNPKRLLQLFLKLPNKRVLFTYAIFLLVRLFFGRSKRCHRLLYRLKPI